MGYGAADDIVLRGPNSQNQRKKGKAGKIILFLIFLLFILGGATAGYWYYLNYIYETPKAAFFKYVGDNNFESVLNLDVYENMLNQMNEKSFFAETTADLTTNMKNDLTEIADGSKFDFALNISADRSNQKSLLDAKISYSSNDLFNLKLLNTKDNIGIFSEDILDKYIASSKNELNNSLTNATGKETNISSELIDDSLNSIIKNKIEIDDQYKIQKAKEYSDEIFNLIPEESVTKKENVVVTIDSETINTDAYTLILDNDKYKEILQTILEKLKNDNEFLDKIVTGEEIDKEYTDIQSTPINEITNIQTKTEITEGELESHQTEMIVGEEIELTEPSNQLEIVTEPETDLVNDTSLDTTVVPEINLDLKNNETDESLYKDLIKVIILGQKIKGTRQDLQEKIEKELSNISLINDELEITIYVRNEDGKEHNTVKLSVKLSQNTTCDIEYIGKTKFRITYLYPTINEEDKEIITGYSLDVEKTSTDVNIKYNLQYSMIENKKVVSKTQIELQTSNANHSKGYTNNAIVKYTTSDGDLKVNLKNEIKFQEENISEDLNDENTIFLDKLSKEDAQELYEQILEKFIKVYSEKIVSLSFIDNNSSNAVVQQPIQTKNEEEKAKIKSKLIETISNMMGEAEQKGEVFTIENLRDFSIEGYDVSSSVTADLAIIKINGYTFNIDKDFMLTEQ